VAGHVTDDSGKPVTQYVVVLQPAEQKDPRITARFIRTARPDTEGRFELRTVRPGRTSRRRSRRLKKAASSRRSSRRSCVAAHASSG
jgi:protocatechuate 3,4-dioxygenase beta subunit